MSADPEQLTRRDRQRAATIEEILTSARTLLRAHGVTAVSLRAIARDVGMTPPGLYRYFPSHEELLGAMVASLFDELVGDLHAARDAETDIARRVVAVSRRFRRWGVANPQELTLLFATPIPAPGSGCSPPKEEAAERFGRVFQEIFAELWASRPFPIRPVEELDPRFLRQFEGWSPQQTGLPPGAAEIFLRCWARLYGTVMIEASGHVQFALDDAEPLFELEMSSMAAMVGIGPEEIADVGTTPR